MLYSCTHMATVGFKGIIVVVACALGELTADRETVCVMKVGASARVAVLVVGPIFFYRSITWLDSAPKQST